MEVVEPQIMRIPNSETVLKTGGHIGDELSEVPLSAQAGSESTTTPRKVILADFNRLMAEIEASSLMQEELIRSEPQLASTTSFLYIVSGGAMGKSGTGGVSGGMADVAVYATVPKETIHSVSDARAAASVAIVTGAATAAGVAIDTGAATAAGVAIVTGAVTAAGVAIGTGPATAVGIMIPEGIAVITSGKGVADVRPDADVADIAMKEKALWEARYKERMRVTRITAAKSLLKDELRKVHPSNASIAAFREAAYGDESGRETSSGQGGERPDVSEQSVEATAKATDELTTVGKEPDKILPEDGKEAVRGVDEGTASGGITSEDDEIGESDYGGEISDEYSVSGQSTSGGESVVSRGSRKKRADESPEREVTGSARKGFPRVVSRSEAGCRIHIPSTAEVTTASSVTIEGTAGVHTATPTVMTEMGVEVHTTTPTTTIKMPVEAHTAAPTVMTEMGVEVHTATPTTTTKMPVEAHTAAPTVMTEMGVEAHTAAPTTTTEMPVEAHTAAPTVMTERGVEAHTALPTTTTEMPVKAHIDTPTMTTDMDVEVPNVAPLTTEEKTIEVYASIPLLVSVVNDNIARTGSVVRQAESAVPMEVAIEELCKNVIPGSKEEHWYTTSIDSTTTTAAACQEQIPIDPSLTVATDAVVAEGSVNATVNIMRPLAVEVWGRGTMMVEGIFRIIEGMEPPWITLNVLEIAAVQFPTVDCEVLRHTIMTILMSQRRCVVRLTRAGLRRGPRTDGEGNAFVELDLDYADRYSNSH